MTASRPLRRGRRGLDPGAPLAGDQRQDFDLLTVRNRLYSSSVTLEYSFRKLRELHDYRKIHCAFGGT